MKPARAPNTLGDQKPCRQVDLCAGSSRAFQSTSGFHVTDLLFAPSRPCPPARNGQGSDSHKQHSDPGNDCFLVNGARRPRLQMVICRRVFAEKEISKHFSRPRHRQNQKKKTPIVVGCAPRDMGACEMLVAAQTCNEHDSNGPLVQSFDAAAIKRGEPSGPQQSFQSRAPNKIATKHQQCPSGLPKWFREHRPVGGKQRSVRDQPRPFKR